MNPTRPIQAVIFDLDDTLLDWSAQELQWQEMTRRGAVKVRHFLIKNGYEMPAEAKYAQILGQKIGQVWEEAKKEFRGPMFSDALNRSFVECGIDPTEINIEDVMRAYDWGPIPGVDLFPATIPTLDALSEQGYKLGMITNAFQPMWMRDAELEHFGLIDYFPNRITSGDTGYMKPHPAIYWRMMGMLRVTPDQSIFVGDRLDHDIAGANEVGMTSVWIKPRRNERSLNGVKSHHTIDTLDQLLPILDSLQNSA